MLMALSRSLFGEIQIPSTEGLMTRPDLIQYVVQVR